MHQKSDNNYFLALALPIKYKLPTKPFFFCFQSLYEYDFKKVNIDEAK